MPMAGFYVLNISPSRSQTHPNLPQGKGQVTLPMISANEHQPPLVLPRRGDAGYYVTVKDWLTKVTLVTDKG